MTTTYNRRDVEIYQQRARLHHELEMAELSLLRAAGCLSHEHTRDLVTAAGRLHRIQELLGELREIMVLGERDYK